MFASVPQRWALLAAMGACLAILLDSQSPATRLIAGVALIISGQMREISLLSDVEPVRIKRKEESKAAQAAHGQPQPASALQHPTARKDFALHLMRQKDLA